MVAVGQTVVIVCLTLFGLVLLGQAEPSSPVGEVGVLVVVLDGTKVAVSVTEVVIGRHSLSGRHGVDCWDLRFCVFGYDGVGWR